MTMPKQNKSTQRVDFSQLLLNGLQFCFNTEAILVLAMRGQGHGLGCRRALACRCLRARFAYGTVGLRTNGLALGIESQLSFRLRQCNLPRSLLGCEGDELPPNVDQSLVNGDELWR